MHLELPEHLHSTRDLLMRSLPVHPLEKAPAMPAGLADDLTARFGRKTVVVTRVVERTSLLGKVRAFLATPAFGIAAAVVVALGVAAPTMTSKPSPQETFRGTDSPAVAGGAVTILFVGTNPALQSAVENSGNFEPSAFRSSVDLASAQEVTGAKVVIDFNTEKIHAVDASGAEAYSARIPARADKVAGAVAEAVSRL
jgi:hypothetical protein